VISPDVRLGDWRDVLPGTYDPARAVVVTDPPFGIRDDVDRGYVDELRWTDHVRDLLELLPAARHVIRGPANAVLRRDYPQPRRLGIETAAYRRRAAHRPGTVPYLWHAWCIYGGLRIGRRRLAPSGDVIPIRPYADDGLRLGAPGRHRGLTPYASAWWAVETWCEPGWIVLDPYAGTGTIGRVAGALGLDYIGAERDPAWWAECRAGLLNNAPRLEMDG